MKVVRLQFLVIFGVSAVTSSNNFYRYDEGQYLSLLYYHHVIPAAQVSQTMETSSMCNCKSLCLMKSCATVSMVKTSSGNFVCNVSMTQISVMKLEKIQQGLTYAHREDPYFLGSDGIFYKIEKSNKNFDDAKKYCNDKFEIGQLMMPKTTLQMQGLLEFRHNISMLQDDTIFYVDLTYDKNKNAAVWGDGTLYKESQISKYIDLETSETDLQYAEVMKNSGGEDEYFLGSDGVFYEVEKSPKNHEDSKKFCEDKYEIGSLIMPKTIAQMQGILEYRQKIGTTKSGTYYLINLTYDPERGEAVWGDGTLYKDSEISKYIDLETSETDTYYREVMRNPGGNYFNSYNEESWVMCQLKPLP